MSILAVGVLTVPNNFTQVDANHRRPVRRACRLASLKDASTAERAFSSVSTSRNECWIRSPSSRLQAQWPPTNQSCL